MKYRLLLGVTAAAVCAGAVFAASRPPVTVREAVAAMIDARLGEPQEGEPKSMRTPSDAMFRRVEINNDGVTDWRIDYGKAPNASYFCGTGGCLQQLWVSDGEGGFSLVFERVVRRFTLTHPKSGSVLDIDFHGSQCGGFGVDPCDRRYAWNERAGRFEEAAGPDGQTFLYGGPSPVLVASAERMPGVVLEAVKTRDAACARAGGTYRLDEALVADVADLNGDGVRDWVVGGLYDGCQFDDSADDAPEFPVAVYVSGQDGYSKVWEDHPMAWGLDLAGRPAAFVTLSGDDGCGLNGKGCTATRWRWTGQALVAKSAEQP